MPRRTSRDSRSDEQAPMLLAMPREDAHTRLGKQVAEGEQLKQRPIRSREDLEAARSDRREWSDYSEELLRRMFTTSRAAEEYTLSYGGMIGMIGGQGLHEDVEDFRDSIESRLGRLRSILKRLDLIPIASGVPDSRDLIGADTPLSTKIFVVHGHDEAARESVARFLERLGLLPIILHEQASKGQTIVEKLEAHGDVSFAVVLLTPDDVGGAQATDLQPRARQNVVLELGYFLGRLGRAHVCALHRGPIELPSDLMGVVYVPLDSGNGWHLRLARELKAAGLAVDLNEAV